MLSIVIPTYNSSESLEATIQALVTPPYVREVIVVDGGSHDGTQDIAQQQADRLVTAEKGRGSQLRAGAQAAKGDWLLFLHADTVLEQNWGREVSNFIAANGAQDRAAYFTFALDDESDEARRLEKIVCLRCRLLGLPYGDQGLLIRRAHYEKIGGFRDIPLMEDVDIVRRIGKKHLHGLATRALTSAQKYRKLGYGRRMARNVFCLSLYFLGISPQRILKFYK